MIIEKKPENVELMARPKVGLPPPEWCYGGSQHGRSTRRFIAGWHVSCRKVGGLADYEGCDNADKIGNQPVVCEMTRPVTDSIPIDWLYFYSLDLLQFRIGVKSLRFFKTHMQGLRLLFFNGLLGLEGTEEKSISPLRGNWFALQAN